MDLLNHPLIAERYFFPTVAPLADAVHVAVPAGTLSCWRSAPPSERPVLVHFHGNGEIVQDWMGPFVDTVRTMGWEVFLAEYRGYGASTGTPTLGAMLDEDIGPIAEAVGVPQGRIVVFGRSIGSIFAIEWVRCFAGVGGLVLESGIHDLHERLALRVRPEEVGCDAASLRAQIERRVDHAAVLAGWGGRCLVLHAEQDHLVDISHGERNARAAGPRAELVRLPRGDHNSILAANTDAYFAALRRFLASIGEHL